MLRVGDKGSTHTKNELWVDLDVSVDEDGVVLVLFPPECIHVLLVVVERPAELLIDGIAVGELDLDPQFGFRYLFLT